MNVIKQIQRINDEELKHGLTHTSGSWHQTYISSKSATSAYIFIGNIHYELTEGDIIVIFSQYGEVIDCNLVRDSKTGKSRGYCFLAYEDVRSTILAIDNMNGSMVMNRTLRVDHADKYRRPKLLSVEERAGIDDVQFDIENDAEYDRRRKQIWD